MRIVITCLFGLEHYCVEDLENIGYSRDRIFVTDGQVVLDTTPKDMASDAARVCLWSRRGERVLLSIDEFHAETFDDFFDGIASISWVNYIPTGAAFHVNGYSRDSKLFGIPACQSLCKKAIVKALSSLRPTSSEDRIFEDEKIGLVKVVFGIVKDNVNVMIDITGDGLHKRGYRPLMHEAPIKETLAAGMVSAAQYRFFGEEALVDPFCGSGTIVIEAALMALNIAPGLNRKFTAEDWDAIPKNLLKEERKAAFEAIDYDTELEIYGFDINPAALKAATENAEEAGVDDCITFSLGDATSLGRNGCLGGMNGSKSVRFAGRESGVVVTNPPYGERIGDQKSIDRIYAAFLKFFHENPTWSLFMVTSDKTAELKSFGRPADRRRKLFNGRLEVCYYQFHGERPTRENLEK